MSYTEFEGDDALSLAELRCESSIHIPAFRPSGLYTVFSTILAVCAPYKSRKESIELGRGGVCHEQALVKDGKRMILEKNVLLREHT